MDNNIFEHVFSHADLKSKILLIRRAKSTGLPNRLLVFLTPSTDLQGGRTFILVLKKLHFCHFNFFSDFYLFFVCINCLIIGSLQPATKYMLFDN